MAVAAGCSPAASAPPKDRDASAPVLVDCRLPDGTKARCGTHTVEEIRGTEDPTDITLEFAVVPSETEGTDRGLPVVLLAGGPGQSAIDAYAPALRLYAPFLRDRDVLLLDQRGTGRSQPIRCDTPDEELGLEEALSVDVDVERLTACKQAHMHLDLGAYTTPRAVADLAEVLDALGYDQVNLVGGSYGTRMALAFARRHPNRVRTMVLDGVAPVDMAIPLSFAGDADRAIDAMVRDCAAEPACAEAFGDLGAMIDDLLEPTDATPPQMTVEHPRTGEAATLDVDRELLLQGIRGILYVPDLAALLPLSLSRAAAGDFDPLLAQTLLLSDGMRSSMADGMYLSVMCTEDVPFITDAEVAEQAAPTRFGTKIVDDLRKSCEHWHQGELPADYREPVSADVPTLLLSGEIDPVTPSRWAEHAAQTLPNARTVTVPGAGHGVIVLPCVAGMVDRFMDTADPAGLDVSCVGKHRRPPFFIDFAGPTLQAAAQAQGEEGT